MKKVTTLAPAFFKPTSIIQLEKYNFAFANTNMCEKNFPIFAIELRLDRGHNAAWTSMQCKTMKWNHKIQTPKKHALHLHTNDNDHGGYCLSIQFLWIFDVVKSQPQGLCGCVLNDKHSIQWNIYYSDFYLIFSQFFKMIFSF